MKKRYKNSFIKGLRRSPKDIIALLLGRFPDILSYQSPPEDFKYPLPEYAVDSNRPKALWIGHSTYFIEIDGVRFLTDPIWSQRASPFSMIGPKRLCNPPIEIERLPKIDFVLISHNHYDHLDEKSIKRLYKRFPYIEWIVPRGVKSWFSQRGIKRVRELSWWEELSTTKHPFLSKITFSSVPAQHNSGRGIFDINKTLWMGIVVTTHLLEGGSKRFYFVGDTAYNRYDFKKIGERYPAIDLCLCPIGTYAPSSFMRTVHSSPEDAVNIHRDVGATLSLAMHWKTFKLSLEDINRPPYDLYLAIKKYNLNPYHFLPIEPGKEINW